MKNSLFNIRSSQKKAEVCPAVRSFHLSYYHYPYQNTAPNDGLRCAMELATASQRISLNKLLHLLLKLVIGAVHAAISPPPNYYKIIRSKS